MSEDLTGSVPDEHFELVDELIDSGKYESYSEFVRFATSYTLDNKHNAL